MFLNQLKRNIRSYGICLQKRISTGAAAFRVEFPGRCPEESHVVTRYINTGP